MFRRPGSTQQSFVVRCFARGTLGLPAQLLGPLDVGLPFVKSVVASGMASSRMDPSLTLVGPVARPQETPDMKCPMSTGGNRIMLLGEYETAALRLQNTGSALQLRRHAITHWERLVSLFRSWLMPVVTCTRQMFGGYLKRSAAAARQWNIIMWFVPLTRQKPRLWTAALLAVWAAAATGLDSMASLMVIPDCVAGLWLAT